MTHRVVEYENCTYMLVSPTFEERQQPRFWANLAAQYVGKTRHSERVMVDVPACRRVWVKWGTMNDEFPVNYTEQFHPDLLKELLNAETTE